MLRVLRQAVAQRRRICLRYSRRDVRSGTPHQTRRDVDPYHLTRLADDWYLTAYCHLRRAIRVFRLTRIDELAILETTFDDAGPQAGGMEGSHDQPLFVQALFQSDMARWARESLRDTVLEEEATRAGVRFTLLVESQGSIVRSLLGWGGDVRVLEPAWLQALLLWHAERIVQHYRPDLQDD